MGIKNRWKRNFVLIIAVLAILMSMLSPTLTTFADLSEANQKFDSESSEFLEDAEEARDILGILDKDSKVNPKPERNTISYVMRRLLYPGEYVNDVRDGVVSSSIGRKKSEILYDDKYACNPDSDNPEVTSNLIDHNCNIPNFTTGFIQNIASPFLSTFSNADKSTSYSVFGLGVPANIPGGTVPVNPESRTNTYTALELFGYDLQLTSYNGEWDQIVVSSSARMLSNFGVIDRITLVGTGLWNTLKDGVGKFIENFSFNPLRWYGNIAKSFESGASSGINTVLDTSDLNIVATNAWKRPRLDGSLYNVYVMSDAEVLRETARNYFAIFSEVLKDKSDESAELNEVLAMNPDRAFEDVTGFSYDPTWETAESVTAREKAEAARAGEESHNANERFLEQSVSGHFDESYTANIISPLTEIPEPVFYTESEQMGFWEEDPAVAGILSIAQENGLTSGSASSYETYEEMMSEWEEAYTPYFETKFDALGETVGEILEDTDATVFMEHPKLDPKQGISRYACSNADGSIKRNDKGEVEYLYEANNKGTTEFLNPNCEQARPPIGGGLLGTGTLSQVITDTRHVSNVTDDGLGILHKVSNIGVSTVRSLNSFIAKVTNVILDLSFSPILEKLGIDEIVAKLVEGFRDTVFFPLATLIAAAGALLLFFQVLKNGSAWQLLGSFAITLIIFVAGAAFLLHPSATIKLVDEVPSKLDRIISDAVLVDNDDSSYCSTGDSSDGIRSAQCNVWGAMVFEPWVHLQFGTGSDNLYAKGHAPSGSGEMQNKNEDLVGDARVNMGGGRIENNWALYQLSKTKSGTINAEDPKRLLGMIDKDLYRLVDLQAGPHGGANSDARYFETWNGTKNGGFLVFLTLVQAILMSIAIAGLGFAKIEVSFMFSISIIFLPIMLLYGLVPKGRNKLKGYLSNLISLMLKRIIITVMLAVLLKVITISFSKANSLETGALIAIFVSLAFIIYRKELLELMTSSENGKGILGGDTKQVKEAISNSIPTVVKQSYNVAKANVRGATSGFVGASIGATGQKASIHFRRANVQRKLANLDKDVNLTEDQKIEREALQKESDGIDFTIQNKKRMTKSELDKLEEEGYLLEKELLENEVEIGRLINEGEEGSADEILQIELKNDEIKKKRLEISNKTAGGERDSRSVFAQALRGSNHSQRIIGRTAERKIRSEGYAPLTAIKEVKEAVYTEGADKITSLEEDVEHDVYKEVLSRSKNDSSKTSAANLKDEEKGELARDPRLQKRIRQLANKRKNISKQEGYTAATPDISELEKAAKVVDRRRGREKVRLAATRPMQAHKNHHEDIQERNKDKDTIARTAAVMRDIDEFLAEGGAGTIDRRGDTIIQDRSKEKESDQQRVIRGHIEDINELKLQVAHLRKIDENELNERLKELDKLVEEVKPIEEDE